MSQLVVKNLDVSYGKNHILSGVTLPTLSAGDVLGLLGPNAAGKSTLLRAISGQAASTGELWLDGISIEKAQRQQWQPKLSYMPQSPPQASSLLPFELLWNAAKAMALPVSAKKLNREIEELFTRLGLLEFAYSPMYSLSGGKRQLVGLALALLRKPEVLLLDEPTSALDLHWRMVVLDFVSTSIRGSGGIAITALHDLDLALRYCNKLVLLDRGQVVASGLPFDVLNKKNIADVYHVDADIIDSNPNRPLIQINSPIGNA